MPKLEPMEVNVLDKDTPVGKVALKTSAINAIVSIKAFDTHSNTKATHCF